MHVAGRRVRPQDIGTKYKRSGKSGSPSPEPPRVIVKRNLQKYVNPADMRESTTNTVLQAELLSNFWTEVGQTELSL
jgi:hypothetical protein